MQLNLYRQSSAGGGRCCGRSAILQSDVLDDGEAEACAAEPARTPLVYAVETLEDVGEVFGRNARAIVGEGKVQRVADGLGLHAEIGGSNGVGQGIAEYVAEERVEQ